MTVHFVGAGPGAADLLTVRAAGLLATARVVLYAGSLIPAEVVALCDPGAEVTDTANLDLDEIIGVIADADAAGRDVVRLHSGDPSVFSAVAEQGRRLDALGIPWTITPGVPAFAAAAAALKRELTLPRVGQTVILTRIASRATPMPPGEDLPSLARSGATLALHLAVQEPERLVSELVPHYGLDCPVAVVARASWPDEQVLRGTLGELPGMVADAGIRRTAIVFIGRVLGDPAFGDSHLYSIDRLRNR